MGYGELPEVACSTPISCVISISLTKLVVVIYLLLLVRRTCCCCCHRYSERQVGDRSLGVRMTWHSTSALTTITHTGTGQEASSTLTFVDLHLYLYYTTATMATELCPAWAPFFG